jgi:hypothetical protein
LKYELVFSPDYNGNPLESRSIFFLTKRTTPEVSGEVPFLAVKKKTCRNEITMKSWIGYLLFS